MRSATTRLTGFYGSEEAEASLSATVNTNTQNNASILFEVTGSTYDETLGVGTITLSASSHVLTTDGKTANHTKSKITFSTEKVRVPSHSHLTHHNSESAISSSTTSAVTEQLKPPPIHRSTSTRTTARFTSDFGTKAANFPEPSSGDEAAIGSFTANYVGKIATSTTKLRDLEQFWNTQTGVFMLERPQVLTVSGGMETVKALCFVCSVIPGYSGELTLSSAYGEIIDALGLNTTQSAQETSHTASVYNAHDGAVIAQNVKTSGNILREVIGRNIDVEFDAMSGVNAVWCDKDKNFILTPEEDTHTSFLHIVKNNISFQIGSNKGEKISLTR